MEEALNESKVNFFQGLNKSISYHTTYSLEVRLKSENFILVFFRHLENF